MMCFCYIRIRLLRSHNSWKRFTLCNIKQVPSCTQSQIDNEGYRRIKLQVSANSSPSCKAHGGGPGILCNLRTSTGFGQTTPYLSGVPCRPWANIFFVRADDPTRFVEVSFIKHWSWSKSNKLVYFTVSQASSVNAAISLVNAAFDNRGSSQVLNINIVNGAYQGLPTNYSPGNFNAFTYVYGRGKFMVFSISFLNPPLTRFYASLFVL